MGVVVFWPVFRLGLSGRLCGGCKADLHQETCSTAQGFLYMLQCRKKITALGQGQEPLS